VVENTGNPTAVRAPNPTDYWAPELPTDWCYWCRFM